MSHNRGKGLAIQWLRDNADHDGDACLIWPFSRVRGYGHFGHNGEQHSAHRYMCELAHGPAPFGKDQAAHSCGKGHDGCVNPRHLRWASKSENQRERRKHGTWVGSTWGRQGKLTIEQIGQIRALAHDKTQDELAEMFGVHRPTIRRWIHSTDLPTFKPGSSRATEWRRRRAASVSGK